MGSQRPTRAEARRFQRIRDDHATETAEDYTELVLTLGDRGQPIRAADLAREQGVSHVTVLRTLRRLQRDGFVRRGDQREILLTAAGLRLAQGARERHRTVLDFLLALGVSQAQAAIDAEGIEHHVSRETLRRMREWVDAQTTCGGGAPPRP